MALVAPPAVKCETIPLYKSVFTDADARLRHFCACSRIFSVGRDTLDIATLLNSSRIFGQYICTMAKWGEGDPRWIVEERADATNVNNWHW